MSASRAKAPEVREVSDAEIEGILHKLESMLNADDLDTMRHLVETLKYVMAELEKKRVSLARLKRVLFGVSSEKTRDVELKDLLARGLAASGKTPPLDVCDGSAAMAADGDDAPLGDAASNNNADSAPEAKPKAKPKGHGRRGADEYTGATRNHVTHPDFEPKDPCPKCPTGKLYLQKHPKVLVRLTGSAPIQATIWTYDWLRCNRCGAITTAPLPEEVGPGEKCDESVTATIGLLCYGFGMPFNRLARLQEHVNIPLPASTQWDLVSGAAQHFEPVFTEYIRAAAAGDVVYNDDTTERILELMAENKAKAATASGRNERTGIFTSGVVSTLGERKIALYFSGRKHAGENLEDVLAMCAPGRGPLVQMSDALARNEPKKLPEDLEVIKADCLSHGRRKYVEIADRFTEQCLHVLQQLEIVYKADAKARKDKMSPQERLSYHQEESRPVMDELKKWLQKQLDDKLVEPNSGFGEATNYMLKRWDRLTRFLTVAGAPIDNNICERALKRAIRHRKNSLFYKTLRGARVGGMYMSFIHTCELNAINPFEYLTALIRQGERVADDPQAWLPWNYAAARAVETTTTPTAV